MNILANIHAYPPDHNSGAEWMLKDYLDTLTDQGGHDIFVLTNKIEQWPFQTDHKLIADKYRWADIVITHLNKQGDAYNRCKQFKKPLVFINHNTHKGPVMELAKQAIIINNSKWTANNFQGYSQEQYLCRPIIRFDRLNTKGRKSGYVTLINGTENKGGEILCELAKANPSVKFLLVKGSYGTHPKDVPNNVTQMDNTPDISEVYKKTAILLMLSGHESFGRVAIEASHCGIPVISSKAPGIMEAMGDKGNYVDRTDIKQIAKMIKKISGNYQHYKDRALRRADEYKNEVKNDFNNFIKAIDHAYRINNRF